MIVSIWSASRKCHACAGLHDRERVLVRQFGELGVFGGSLDVRHDYAFVIGADNRVGLPVSDAAFCGDNRRPLIDIDAVQIQPAPRILALAPVVFFAAVTQVKIQRAPVFLVFPAMFIDALVTAERRCHASQNARRTDRDSTALASVFLRSAPPNLASFCAACPRPLGVSARPSRALA